MAFVTLEDLVGSVEILVFPKLYERYQSLLNDDERLFVRGHVSVEDDKPSKLIADDIWTFDEVPSELWMQFETQEAYGEKAEEISRILIDGQSMGDGYGYEAEAGRYAGSLLSRIAVYVKHPKRIKDLRFTAQMYLRGGIVGQLKDLLGEDNVSVVPGKLPERPYGRQGSSQDRQSG